MFRRLLTVLEMIKFQHTVFALPFAVVGAAYGAMGWPPPATCLWILGAMVGARSAAMTFNRIVDARFDAANPRTAGRAIPKGLVSMKFAIGFLVASLALFFASAAMLNQTVLLLSPVAAVIILGYSFTKRFTPLSHFVLGLSLALAPVGAWLAVNPLHPTLAWFPVFLGAGVLFWVAGFDILYACEDAAFDRSAGLKSVPAAIGIPRALWVARACHAAALTAFAAPLLFGMMGWYALAVLVVSLLLVYEHTLVKADDLRRTNRAFFHVNAIISFTLAAGALVDLALAWSIIP
ncbi:MAG TPA: UbiA-like polyprenyltransferase [Planctomycetota bacterium]|nr:UbiA-like polyprenyltransferase [Planctomycetota bacterium]